MPPHRLAGPPEMPDVQGDLVIYAAFAERFGIVWDFSP